MPVCPNSHATLPQYDGIVVLNKPQGLSSAQCLRPFKRQGQKKIGHAGTLDPMATGVLIVLLGQATKLSGWLLESGEKVYSGVIRLGIETDSWDMTGNIIGEKTYAGITETMLAAAISEWTQLKEQEVPAYSAAKHHGQPLYKLARKGHDTPAKRKCVHIAAADLLAVHLPFVRFRVRCGSGSYVRSLAHSLGMRLGCGAVLAGLIREYSHPFALADSVSLAEIESELQPAHIRPLTAALPGWPCVELEPAEAAMVRNGMRIVAKPELRAPLAFLQANGKPLAIARLQAANDGIWWQVARGLGN